MKRIVSLALAIAICTGIHAQIDTLGICDKAENYFYSTPWMDDYNIDCNGNCLMAAKAWDIQSFKPAIVTKKYITDTTLNIIGIAAPVIISSTGIGIDLGIASLDTTTANRNPEYFYLYQANGSNLILKGRARWDSLPTQQRMEMHICPYYNQTYYTPPYSLDTCYVDVREAYFPKSIAISDTFYVGASMFNNHMSTVNNIYALPRTYYLRWQTEPSATNCSFGYCGADYNDLVRYYDDNNPSDTSWHFNPYIWNGFGCIFPIFDTSSDTTTVIPETPDTCTSPTNLRVMDIIESSVMLTWDDNTNYLWELNIVKEGNSPDSGYSNTYYNNYANLTNLDTAQWYVARVRAICNSDNRSQWSDSCRFYLPNYHTEPIGINKPQNLLETYTLLLPNPATNTVTLFSSFHIKKIELFSLNGRQLISMNADSLSASLNIADYPAGIYIVRITTASGIVFKRLVKE